MIIFALVLSAILIVPFGAWIYLLRNRGGFWLCRERDDVGKFHLPVRWPSVVAVVPARNEGDVIAHAISTLLTQDYPGPFRIVLVDDRSNDGTGRAARITAKALRVPEKLTVITGEIPPQGWTGKVWAMKQGVTHTLASGDRPDYILFTDADIGHKKDNLRLLVMRAEERGLVLTSLMAKLHCKTLAEKLLIPAFVFFFAMLYPFRWVNDPRSSLAAAAGGVMLVKREALEKAGGIDAIHGALIDDCALASQMKKQGPIWLGLTNRAVSLRPYMHVKEIRRMVARSAYSQLGYSVFNLAGAVLGMLMVYAAPVVVLLLAWPFPALQIAALAVWLLMAIAYLPIARFYRLSPLWGLALPIIGGLYVLFTLDSAIAFWRGKGGMWKGRVQAITS